ncbi:hypothetical protein [Candidatus Palauibacter sp.]|uniref:hypothetical protein n=1 Tax=Candidatus Palauibacter sp. TaxID=3101350 RepID=UPI003B0222E9
MADAKQSTMRDAGQSLDDYAIRSRMPADTVLTRRNTVRHDQAPEASEEGHRESAGHRTKSRVDGHTEILRA